MQKEIKSKLDEKIYNIDKDIELVCLTSPDFPKNVPDTSKA